MKKILSLLMLAGTAVTGFAQTTYTTINTFGDWAVPGHWAGGVVPPDTLRPNDIVNINHNTFIVNKNISNGGVWRVKALINYNTNTKIINNGKIVIDSVGQFYTTDKGSSITNNNAISMGSANVIVNVSKFINNGYLFNDGGHIQNYQKLFYNGVSLGCSDSGVLVNNNIICNSNGGVVDNDCGSYTSGNAPLTNCPSTLKDSVMNAAIPTLGINRIAQEDVTIYPNPASSVVTINVKSSTLKNANVELFDIAGKRVITSTLSNNDINIDLSGLTNGVYFLKIIASGDHAMLTRKIIKL